MIKVYVVEDDKIIGDSIITFLKSQDSIEFVGHSDSLEHLCPLLKHSSNCPDIILLDIVLPGASGISGIKTIKEYWPDTDIIMFSVMDDGDSVFQSLCEGAVGFITKDVSLDELLTAVIDVASGKGIMSPSIARKVAESFHTKRKVEKILSSREQEIVDGIMDGLSYKLLADKLCISIDTVRKHIKSVYKKLQINSKAQLMAKLYRK